MWGWRRLRIFLKLSSQFYEGNFFTKLSSILFFFVIFSKPNTRKKVTFLILFLSSKFSKVQMKSPFGTRKILLSLYFLPSQQKCLFLKQKCLTIIPLGFDAVSVQRIVSCSLTHCYNKEIRRKEKLSGVQN